MYIAFHIVVSSIIKIFIFALISVYSHSFVFFVLFAYFDPVKPGETFKEEARGNKILIELRSVRHINISLA